MTEIPDFKSKINIPEYLETVYTACCNDDELTTIGNRNCYFLGLIKNTLIYRIGVFSHYYAPEATEKNARYDVYEKNFVIKEDRLGLYPGHRFDDKEKIDFGLPFQAAQEKALYSLEHGFATSLNFYCGTANFIAFDDKQFDYQIPYNPKRDDLATVTTEQLEIIAAFAEEANLFRDSRMPYIHEFAKAKSIEMRNF